MADAELEQILRDLPRRGTLVKDRGYRQVWRFDWDGRGYYLKFYPRHSRRDWWRRLFRGSPALREFERLQRLQKANIPAPRAVAFLAGLRIEDDHGDAIILHAVEPAVPLDQYLNDLELRGERAPDHLDLSRQVCALVHQLAKAKLGHEDLHLGNFLLHTGERKVYLLDGYAVRPDGLKLTDVLLLGHSAGRFATRSDILRGWRLLGPEGAATPPLYNRVSNRIYRLVLGRSAGENRYFGRLGLGEWNGLFFKHAKYPRRWSQASQTETSSDDWARAWPEILRRLERDEFEVLKRSRSGDVLAGDIEIGGRTVPVVIKRPRRRYWYRYLNEIGRGARARRAWFKSWSLIARNLPTAWPLLLMEKRSLGYVTDNIIAFERVPGPTLAKADLDAIPQPRRQTLFRRAGKILRRIEQYGFAHFDAKASNWIVMPDERRGETPVLIDPDGIRRRRWVGLGIERLLKSMREHAQYTPEDSLELCRGYAPTAYLHQEEEDEEAGAAPVLKDADPAESASGDAGVAPAGEDSKFAADDGRARQASPLP